MKLSAELLAYRLKSNFRFQCKKNLSETLNLEQVMFFVDGEDPQPNKIFICSGVEKPTKPQDLSESSVYLCIGNTFSQQIVRQQNVFLFAEGTKASALFNSVQKIFDYFGRWEEMLLRESAEGNLQTMLDESYRIFRNPLILASSDFFVIAYSSVIDERPELQSLVDPDAIFEYTKESKENQEGPDYTENRNAFLFPGYITGSGCLCVNIFEKEKYAYRLSMVEEVTRIERYLHSLMEYLALFLQTALSKQMFMRNDIGYRPDRILSDIISGEQKDADVIRQTFSEFGWEQNHSYLCISLKLAALDLEELTDRFVSSHIEKLLPHSCAFPMDKNIAVFVNLTRFDGDTEDALDKIIFFLRDSFLKAGISNTFTGFEHMADYYRQAVIALNVGNQKHPFKWVHRFNDVALLYELDCCKGELPAELICSDKILMLRAFDRLHHTDYYNTIETYIKHNLNAVQTAKDLFIHRSTFLYRMEKIKEITQLDLEDYDTLLYVMISFKILDSMESANAAEVLS